MNKADFLTKLANNNREILATHYDTKSQLLIDDVLMLIASGFEDCSYGNDECPSFSITHNIYNLDPLVLMFQPRTEEEKKESRIYGEHKNFSVFVYGSGEHHKSFKWIKDAISYYHTISHQQIRTQYEK